MQDLQAKDFLVQQAAEQAALENVPPSDLEKRMMYFTESGEMRENAVALNDAFEAEYDNEEYEAKISKLLRHAYKRIKKENPEAVYQWKEAVKQLYSGDNYLSVLLGIDIGGSDVGERPLYDSLKLLGASLLAVIGLVSAAFIADHYGLHWPRAKSTTHLTIPTWMRRLLWGLMIAAYIYYAVLPWVLKKPPAGLSRLVLSLFRAPKRPQ